MVLPLPHSDMDTPTVAAYPFTLFRFFFRYASTSTTLPVCALSMAANKRAALDVVVEIVRRRVGSVEPVDEHLGQPFVLPGGPLVEGFFRDEAFARQTDRT